MVCSHCGYDNPQAAAYCARCQRPLQQTAPASTMPSANDVAKAILQRRQQQEAAIHEERTVVARVPLQPTPAEQRPVQPTPAAQRPQASPPAQVVQPTPAAQRPVQPSPAAQAPRPAPTPVQPTPAQRPAAPVEATQRAARPTSPFETPFQDDEQADNEPTAIFQAPTFEAAPQRRVPVEPTRSAVDPARAQAAAQADATRTTARPAAAPSLPTPLAGQSSLGGPAREPAPPRDAATRDAVARVQARNATLQSPLRTEPGVPASVLRPGATPPQRQAPRPPGAAQPSPFTPPAGWRLLLAHFIDDALLVAVFFAFAFIDGSLSSTHVVSGSVVEWLSNHSGSAFRAALITILAGTTYHLILDLSGGRTLGRIVSGTELARRSGKPLNWFVVLLRTALSYVSIALFGAGFFWAIVDRRGRCLHDLIAGTVVIRHRA